MMNRGFLLSIVLLLAFAGNSIPKSGACTANVENVLNEMVTIEGTVVILNHPDLGRTPAPLTSVIFQRADCSKCLVAARTDEHGNYKIIVGHGRYKIIKQSASEGRSSVDMLASDQPRYIDANSLQYGGNRLDIKVVLPPR
jgi:hypothetical protein